MSAILCPTTDIDLDVCVVPVAVNDGYETAPMVAVLPSPQVDDEETLYASFEEAINARCQTWKRLSDGSLYSVQSHTEKNYASSVSPMTDTLVNDQVIESVHRNWWLGIMVACLALMLILIGFDVMGMLVLAMR